MSSPPRDTPPADVGADMGVDRPHSARIWNYWLGGKDHYPADREAGEMVAQMIPGIVDAARGPGGSSAVP